MNQERINWIIAIVDRGRGNAAASVFEKSLCSILAIAKGHGTASSAIMDCLGLDQPEKELVIGVGARSSSHLLLQSLNQELEFKRPGKGIAFLLPLSGISAAAAGMLGEPADASVFSPSDNTKKENHSMDNAIKYELIASVIGSDLSDPVMEAARKAGCQGGTLVKARDLGSASSRKLFGLTLAQEKDILLILVPKENRRSVLFAICETVQKETGEGAIAFSLPVDEVAGISGTML